MIRTWWFHIQIFLEFMRMIRCNFSKNIRIAITTESIKHPRSISREIWWILASTQTTKGPFDSKCCLLTLEANDGKLLYLTIFVSNNFDFSSSLLSYSVTNKAGSGGSPNTASLLFQHSLEEFPTFHYSWKCGASQLFASQLFHAHQTTFVFFISATALFLFCLSFRMMNCSWFIRGVTQQRIE